MSKSEFIKRLDFRGRGFKLRSTEIPSGARDFNSTDRDSTNLGQGGYENRLHDFRGRGFKLRSAEIPSGAKYFNATDRNSTNLDAPAKEGMIIWRLDFRGWGIKLRPAEITGGARDFNSTDWNSTNLEAPAKEGKGSPICHARIHGGGSGYRVARRPRFEFREQCKKLFGSSRVSRRPSS